MKLHRDSQMKNHIALNRALTALATQCSSKNQNQLPHNNGAVHCPSQDCQAGGILLAFV